ncbi:MAG: DUF362 domain-containing protein [Acidobacteria bacterium]|nr:MAG: DUF362 domain-containing protein [Acidobacteriota bacterium]
MEEERKLMDRREFLKTSLWAPVAVSQAAQSPSPDGSLVVSVLGDSPGDATKAAVRALGGMNKFISKGSVVMVKPNLAFPQHPKVAATTNPEVVKAVIEMALEAGAAKVIIMDNPVGPWEGPYKRCGMQEVAAATGAELRPPDMKRLVSHDFKGAAMMKGWRIFKDFLEVDAFINVPILKTHSFTDLTIGMKNLMGIIENRDMFHGRDIGKRLADLACGFPPRLNIVDANRVISAGGPISGNVIEPKTVIVSANILEADVVAAALLGRSRKSIPYFDPAFKNGMGQIDVKKINLKSYKLGA